MMDVRLTVLNIQISVEHSTKFSACCIQLDDSSRVFCGIRAHRSICYYIAKMTAFLLPSCLHQISVRTGIQWRITNVCGCYSHEQRSWIVASYVGNYLHCILLGHSLEPFKWSVSIVCLHTFFVSHRGSLNWSFHIQDLHTWSRKHSTYWWDTYIGLRAN